MTSSRPKHLLSSPMPGNTFQQMFPTPSLPTSVSLGQLNYNSLAQIRRDIEQQLVERQKQLQESNGGIGKHALARQVSRLQDRLKEMGTHNEELQPISYVDILRSMERDITFYRSHPLSSAISSILKEKLLSQHCPIYNTSTTCTGSAVTKGGASLHRVEKEQAKTMVADKDNFLPTALPKQSSTRSYQAMKVETPKTSLAHTHCIHSGLRSGFHKEETETAEFKKLLVDSQETIGQLQNNPARSADGSWSNVNARIKDSQLGGCRLHKAPTTSSTANYRGEETIDPRRSNSKSRISDVDDSVLSYISMSDSEDSEFDSDVDTDNTEFGKKDATAFVGIATSLFHIGFSQLPSELIQSQAQKPVYVDAQLDTHNIDALPSLLNVINAETLKAPSRSLGDEFGLAMSRSPSSSARENEEIIVKNVAGDLITGVAAAAPLGLGAILKSDDKKAGIVMAAQTEERVSRVIDASIQTDDEPDVASAIENSTQTDSKELHQVAVNSVSVEPKKSMTLQDVTYVFANVEPEDPAIAEAALATAIAESRKAALQAAVDQQVQSESEDPAIAKAALATAIAESRKAALQAAVDQQVQSESEDPAIAKAALATAIAESRKAALQAAVDQQVQSETEDPAIAKAAIATAIAESRKAALQAAVDQQVQSESEDPAIAEAALATAILTCRKKSLESAVDHETQSEVEDPSIAKAATASAIAESRQLAIESAVSQGIQCDPEDPLIHEASIASALLAFRNTALESAVDQEIQSDSEDPADAEAILATAVLASRKKAFDSAVHQATQSVTEDPSITEAAIIASRLASIESGVEQGTQSETEDSSIAIAAAIATSREEAIESAISQETQFDAVAVVDQEIQCDSIVGTDCGVQSESEEQLLADTALAESVLALKQNIIIDTQSEDALDALQNAPTFRVIRPEHQDLKETSGVVPIAAAAAAAAVITLRSNDDVAVTESSHHHAAADEPKDETVPDRVFTKAETDALIASAIANITASQNVFAIDNQHTDALEYDPKRHTYDMFHDKNSSSCATSSHTNDSAIASLSSGLVTREDEEESVTKKDDGNIVVPRQEDIASIASSQGKWQQKPELEDFAITEHYDQAPRRSIESEQQVSEPRSLKLSMGPSIIHAKEPVKLANEATAAGTFDSHDEDENKEDGEMADIPVRPANPPPAALLSKVALLRTCMSSVSVPSSKGEAPYGSHSGLPSPTTNGKASRPEFNNRGSINDDFSMSTSNTNEQHQSISSSRYDASSCGSAGVGAGTTDPNMINLITQTMIGDWMYKYTRKTFGGGFSEKRHLRYFWIHPYTNTLYWSKSGPGGNRNEQYEDNSKCAFIEKITAVQDYNLNTNGLPTVSLLIQTSQRQLKLTAPTMETHGRWLKSIPYIIACNANGTNPGLTLICARRL